MKKLLAVIISVFLAASLMTGCAKNEAAFKDGDYSAKSDPDERGNYGEMKIKVSDGKIAEVDFKEFTPKGPKDENYGKGNEENYKKAQDALKAAKTYGPKLIETQDVEKVDLISGATGSHTLFKDLAKKALEAAKK
ncbi:MAG: FMN-binding protein [Clostridia bacterium]|nr:FMN-binding protein [Clostridia bacterium]